MAELDFGLLDGGYGLVELLGLVFDALHGRGARADRLLLDRRAQGHGDVPLGPNEARRLGHVLPPARAEFGGLLRVRLPAIGEVRSDLGWDRGGWRLLLHVCLDAPGRALHRHGLVDEVNSPSSCALSLKKPKSMLCSLRWGIQRLRWWIW